MQSLLRLHPRLATAAALRGANAAAAAAAGASAGQRGALTVASAATSRAGAGAGAAARGLNRGCPLLSVPSRWTARTAPGVRGTSRSTGGSTPQLRARAVDTMDVDTPAVPSAGVDTTAAAAGAFPKAYVRAAPGAQTVVVTITLGAKTINLNRPVDELLDKALARLAKNLTAKPNKKEKRKKPSGKGAGAGAAEPSSVEASTDDGGGAAAAVLFEDRAGTRPVDRELPNGEAWRRAVLLEVAGERFVLEFNPPTANKITIDRLAMVGYPTAAAVALAFADVDACRWRWLSQRPGAADWTDLGCDTQHYTPTPQDEGSTLRVECTPAAWRQAVADTAAAASDGGRELWLGEMVFGLTDPVQRGPERCSADVRCVHTPSAVAAPAFRILSYNILADQYAGSDYAQNVLFNYCPQQCLDPGYRRSLVLRELLGYNADVLCLQEVDERAYSEFLSLHLGLNGYAGHYTNKQGKVKEGSATFWRTSRFAALAHQDIRLREAFAPPLPPLHSQFAPMLAASKELATALQQVTTIAQATLLAPVDPASEEGCLCVVNTHLFFHPYAPHIRTMHTAGILEEAAAFLARCADGTQPPSATAASAAAAAAASAAAASAVAAGAEAAAAAAPEDTRRRLCGGEGRKPSVLFVGDLNSDLNDGIPGVVELLRRGKLPADYWDWVQGAAFKWGMGEEDAEAMAQGTAQIQAAAAAPTSPTATSPTAAAAATTTSAAVSSSDPAAAAAATSSLFAADGHAFDAAAAAPAAPIAVTGVDITLPYVFRSADDLATPYTNYTSGYKALLDYVWYDDSALRVLRAAPMPSVEELGSFIPSPAFPSDHLAVVYDMEWRREGDGQSK